VFSSLQEDVVTEEVESCSAVHLPHDLLGSGIDALGPAVVVGQGEAGVHGGAFEFEAVAEAVQVGQASGADCGDPLGELVVVALGGGRSAANSPVSRASSVISTIAGSLTAATRISPRTASWRGYARQSNGVA
jgi:hypothetical protein